eukprot:4098552-Pyramimonas_sp.AAC.1
MLEDPKWWLLASLVELGSFLAPGVAPGVRWLRLLEACPAMLQGSPEIAARWRRAWGWAASATRWSPSSATWGRATASGTWRCSRVL